MTLDHRPILLGLAILLLVGCSPAAQPELGDPALIDTCVPSAPAAELGLNTFYVKYCDVSGLHVVSSAEVPNEALIATGEIVAQMIGPLPQTAIAGLQSIDLRIGVIGVDQVTTDMPEYADLDSAFPGVDWDERSRGLGATRERPLTSSGEENLLCYAGARYSGESILVHEFGHTIKDFAMAAVDGTFSGRVEDAYDGAMNAGLWANTYAAANPEDYWAEGVQSYFDANVAAEPPNGVHNHVDTRDELAAYDSVLFDLVDEVFDGATVDASCS
ncbi:MAG: hypothetical protein WD314_00555 [Trueperaceae bacterium]